MPESIARRDAAEMQVEVPINPSEKSLELLLSRYSNSPALITYINVLMEEVSEITEAMISTYVNRHIDYAYGHMLDTIAEIVGVKRRIPDAAPLGLFGWYDEPASLGHGDLYEPLAGGGVLYSEGEPLSGELILTDEELRSYIKATIMINTEAPTLEMLYEYTEVLYGRVGDWSATEGYERGSLRPTLDMHLSGRLNIQERSYFSAVFGAIKILGVVLSLSDLSGNIILRGNDK